jgi:uncharacterized protein with von Willebrand factor type A (vWA) domain
MPQEAPNQDVSDELFKKYGLYKQAFTPEIFKPGNYRRYYNYIMELYDMVVRLQRAKPHLYQLYDVLLMFLRNYATVQRSLKKNNPSAPVWHFIIKRAVKSEDFYKVNKMTSGSLELSLIAGLGFLREVLKEWKGSNLEKTQEELKKQLGGQGQGQGQGERAIQDTIEHAINGSVDDLIDRALANALGSAQEYDALRSQAGGALAEMGIGGGSGGNGFSLEGLSMLLFLEDPDEFRARVRLLRDVVKIMRRFEDRVRVLTKESVVSRWGGVAGVGFGDNLSDVLPSELGLLGVEDEKVRQVGRTLFAWKLVTSTLQVIERATGLEFDIYIDKSGSMDEYIGRGENRAQKIALAAGLGLAVLKRNVGRVYLFDTELFEVDKTEIVRTLLTVRADGGTNIEPVLEEILKRNGDRRHLIISDGITEVANEELLGRFREIADRVFLILINEEPLNYNWVSVLKERGNVFSVWDVASFEEAVSRVITR